MALLVAGAAFHGPLEREPLRHVLQPREPFTATAQAVLLLAFLCTPWPRPSPAAEPFAVLPLLFRFGAAAGAAGPWRLGAQSRHMLGSRFFAVFYPLCLWARLLARLWSSCWAAGLCLVVLAQDSIACRPANDRLLSLSVVPSQCRVPAAAATPLDRPPRATSMDCPCLSSQWLSSAYLASARPPQFQLNTRSLGPLAGLVRCDRLGTGEHASGASGLGAERGLERPVNCLYK